ncbi:hypothetical protein [Thermoflexibacter ruber]|uniref:Uncharacterized protein n=1 Tax=Thermoflexibacter ruber TaxID=1003 RepID=A0A1I2HIC1_9BACT|nr:hypothetical protein [Thermoflexibacter ruber]SFF29894.1 hypothetical protein SAMN04488541_102449 [Thermoflexibacter ruber]
MKRLFLLCSFLLACVFTTFAQQARVQQILTSDIWLVDTEELEASIEAKYAHIDVNRLSDQQKRELFSKREEDYALVKVYQLVEVQFSPNGQYAIRVRGTDQDAGQWQVQNGGKTLVMANAMEQTTYSIESINENTLITINTANNERFTYYPKNRPRAKASKPENFVGYELATLDVSNKVEMRIRPAADGKSFRVSYFDFAKNERVVCDCRIDKVEEGFETGICKGENATDYWKGNTYMCYVKNPATNTYLISTYSRQSTNFRHLYLAAPTGEILDAEAATAETPNAPMAIMFDRIVKWYMAK